MYILKTTNQIQKLYHFLTNDEKYFNHFKNSMVIKDNQLDIKETQINFFNDNVISFLPTINNQKIDKITNLPKDLKMLYKNFLYIYFNRDNKYLHQKSNNIENKEIIDDFKTLFQTIIWKDIAYRCFGYGYVVKEYL